VITLEAGETTPAPWCNVLANPAFGTVISESGSAYTWSENAHEFRLTPWHNDPVSDASGEAFFLRDEESGHFWSPAPLPARGAGAYVDAPRLRLQRLRARGGRHRLELPVYVALDARGEVLGAAGAQHSGRAARLSATGYVGVGAGRPAAEDRDARDHRVDAQSGALFARNAYNTEFPERVAFFDVDDAARSVSGDRAEFLGRNGTLATRRRWRARGSRARSARRSIPCGAIQVAFELADGEEREIVFRLGVGRNAGDAASLVQRFRGPRPRARARRRARALAAHAGRGAGAHARPALDVLANGWLLYQTIACRLWARSGYYQSGGRLRLPRPAAGRDGAGARRARSFASTCCAARGASSSRATCSIGGIRRRGAACARAAPTITSGCRSRPRATWRHGRPCRARRDVPFPRWTRRESPGRVLLRHAAALRGTATLYQHCVRAIEHGLRYGATACR
jgi:cellobiose phosphorylase